MTSDQETLIQIRAPARLHMGFLDMGGSLGRKFGSIGVGLNEIATVITACRSPQLTATGPEAVRALKAATTISEALGKSLPAEIHIEQAIPGHAGLGSGTQLALSVGTALSKLYHLDLSIQNIAAIIGRGARSGIGIAVFEQGGLIVDGGRAPATLVPPVIARLPLPVSWRFLVVLDHRDQGLHGSHEVKAFETLPVFPERLAAHLCHMVMMKGLPAVMEGDLSGFGSVISKLQEAVGDHFAPAQGGRFTSPDVAQAINFMVRLGAVGVGQSSWGPTGFCMVENEESGKHLFNESKARFSHLKHLEIVLATPRLQGAEISCLDVIPA